MFTKYIYIILLLTGCIYTASAQNDIVNFIKSDLANEYKVSKDSVELQLIDSSTYFQIESVLEDVLAKYYIPGYSYINSELNQNNKLLIEKVMDSLRDEDRRLNANCSLSTNNQKELLRNKKGFCLFFSKLCNNQIYIVVMGSKGVLLFDNQYEFYGRANTYLFRLKDGIIENVYRGYIDYN